MERRYLKEDALDYLDFSKDLDLDNGFNITDIKKDIITLADNSKKVIYTIPYCFSRTLAEIYLDENDGFHERQIIYIMENKNPSKEAIIEELTKLPFDVFFYVHDDGEIDISFKNYCGIGCGNMKVRLVGKNVIKLFERIKDFIKSVYGSFEEYNGYTLEIDNGLSYRNNRIDDIPVSSEVDFLIHKKRCIVDSDIKRVFILNDDIDFIEEREELEQYLETRIN